MALIEDIPSEGSQPKTFVPSDFKGIVLNDKSLLLRSEIESMQSAYVEEGAGVTLRHCTSSERPNHDLPAGSFYTYQAHFKYGLRFPVCAELQHVLQYFGVTLAQLLPNSLASVMTYIAYLRRTGASFTINKFQQSFSFRVLKEGYCQFPTRGGFTVLGLENKVPTWKPYFLRVVTEREQGLPSIPQSVKIKVPKLNPRMMNDMSDVAVDVRQYLLDHTVLKKILFPETYAPMSAEDWAESDKLREALPEKVQHSKGGKKRPRSPIDFEELAEEEEDSDVLALPPIPSATTGSSLALTVRAAAAASPPSSVPSPTAHLASSPSDGNQPISMADPMPPPAPRTRRSTVEAERAKKRQQIKKGKAVIVDPPDSDPKISLSSDRKTAFVDLEKEWYQVGEASIMGSLLTSPRLEKMLEVMTVEETRDLCARQLGASWRIIDHTLDEFKAVRKSCKSANRQLQELEKEGVKMRQERSEDEKLLQDTAHALELQQGTMKSMETRLQKTEEALVLLEELRAKADADLLASEQRRIDEVYELTEKVKNLTERLEAVEDCGVETGVQLCLDYIAKRQPLPADWGTAEQILEEAVGELASEPPKDDVVVDDIVGESDN